MPQPQDTQPPAALEQQTSLKRAEASGETEEQSEAQRAKVEKKRTFKGVARLVLAAKRFSNSLNPTYTYGKKQTTSGGGGALAAKLEDGHGASSRPKSPQDHDKYAFPDHGHRFEFLLKPLPPTEDEEEQ